MTTFHRMPGRLGFAALVVVIFSLYTSAQPSRVSQAQVDELRSLPNGTPVCGSILLEHSDRAIQQRAATHPEMHRLAKASSLGYVVGSTHTFWAGDFTGGDDYQTTATCRAVGTHCYIFVEDSMWTNGRVTQAAVDSVRASFDLRSPANSSKGVYGMDVDAFGNPPDVDGDSMIVVFLLNIRDGFSGSGGYVAGYFTARDQYNMLWSNLLDMIYIDAYPQDLTKAAGVRAAMSTTAHEFQHAIHFNYDRSGDELTFFNEGCSLVAEVNCGFAIYDQSLFASEPNHYLFDWRSSSGLNLVLRDYSRAARFMTYVRDRYGMGFFKVFTDNNTQHAIAGFNAALATYGSSDEFTDVLHGWFIANLIDDRSLDTTFGYLYINLPTVTAVRYGTPALAAGKDTVSRLGARYLSFLSNSAKPFQFVATWSNPNLSLYAVEVGSTKRILDVPNGTIFSEPLWGTTYKTIYLVGANYSSSSDIIFTMDSVSVTGVEREEAALPRVTALLPAFPNPFNPQTAIGFQIAEDSNVKLSVYDLLGREVTRLAEGRMTAGYHSATWNALNTASGMYMIRLLVTDQRGTPIYTKAMKAMLMK